MMVFCLIALFRSGAHILAAAEQILTHPSGLPRLYRRPHVERQTHAANGDGQGHVQVVELENERAEAK